MHQEIYRIAYQLNAQGKTPSVALIRSKLSVPASLPVIVQALQKWKQSPELGRESEKQQDQKPADTSNPSADNTAQVSSAKIQAMQAQINALEQKVAHLYQVIETQSATTKDSSA